MRPARRGMCRGLVHVVTTRVGTPPVLVSLACDDVPVLHWVPAMVQMVSAEAFVDCLACLALGVSS